MDHLFRHGDRKKGCFLRCAFLQFVVVNIGCILSLPYWYMNWYSGDLLNTQKRKALSSSRNNSGELPLRIILPSKFIIGPRSPYFLLKPTDVTFYITCFFSSLCNIHPPTYQYQQYIAISSFHCFGSFSSYSRVI